MTSNTLIEVKKKQDAPGWVYLIRFPKCKNCYKIGSTGNLYRRLQVLHCIYSDIDLIAYGYTYNRLSTEFLIKSLLSHYNNNSTLRKRGFKYDFQFAGDVTSVEYFIIETPQICNIIMLLDMLCESVQIGTDNLVYQPHPKYAQLGYGMELRKFYDGDHCKFIPYPTKFSNGFPMYDYMGTWDSIPYEQPIKNFGGVTE